MEKKSKRRANFEVCGWRSRFKKVGIGLRALWKLEAVFGALPSIFFLYFSGSLSCYFQLKILQHYLIHNLGENIEIIPCQLLFKVLERLYLQGYYDN